MSRIGPSRRDEGRVLPNAVSALRRTFASGDGAVANAAPVKPKVAGATVLAPAGGDTQHPGTGAFSIVIGQGATAAGAGSISLGSYSSVSSVGQGAVSLGIFATSTGVESVALGDSANASADRTAAVGGLASGSAVDGTAVGWTAHAAHARSVCIGSGATSAAADTAKVKADSLEIESSSGSGGTSIILKDTVTGTCMRLSIASGVVVVAAA